jgi:hypothetical protein
MTAINDILPPDDAISSSSAPLKEWLPMAKDVVNWQHHIDEYFDSCQKIDESDDESIGDEDLLNTSLKNPKCDQFFSLPSSLSCVDYFFCSALSLSLSLFLCTTMKNIHKKCRTLDTVSSISTPYLLPFLHHPRIGSNLILLLV